MSNVAMAMQVSPNLLLLRGSEIRSHASRAGPRPTRDRPKVSTPSPCVRALGPPTTGPHLDASPCPPAAPYVEPDPHAVRSHWAAAGRHDDILAARPHASLKNEQV